MRTLQEEQGGAEQEGTIPSTPRGSMQISKSEIRLVLGPEPRNGAEQRVVRQSPGGGQSGLPSQL